MHGCGLGSAALVNAEVDSMGGVVDGGVGVGLKTSPRRVAIEKAQAELRQEYDVREERRRELEFLEKGGNPLDFKFGNAASLSVQSTSLTDHHAEHFVNSEAKDSFALTASPHGDSVESIGRPGAPALCEPNTADNFDGENQLLQAEKKSKQSSRRSTVAPSEQSGPMDGAQHAKESEDSAIFRPYARRNRSRPNRDGNRSSSHDVVQGSGVHGCSSVRGTSRDVKGFMFESNDQKNHSNLSLCVPKFPTSNGDLVPRVETTNTHSNMEVDRAVNEVKSPKGNFVGDRSDKAESNFLTEKLDKPYETDAQKVSVKIVSSEEQLVDSKEHVPSASTEYPPAEVIGRAETEAASARPNGFEDQIDGNEIVDISVAVRTKDSESSCSPKNQGLEATDLGTNAGTGDENVPIEKQTSDIERSRDVVVSDVGNKDGDSRTAGVHVLSNECAPVNQNHSVSSPINKIDEEVKSSDLSIDGTCMANREKTVHHNSLPSEVSKSSDNLNARSTSMPRASMDNPDKVFKMENRAHEDSILEEARTIKAKRNRIAELSVLSASYESRRKSHWDFVLEEMAWLANDFAQERLWKMTATAQICHRAALTARLRFSEQNQHNELKSVAHTLAKAVMQFWHSAQTLVNDDNKFSAVSNCKRDSKGSDDVEILNKFRELNKEKFNELERQHSWKASAHAIQAYAVRFLTYNCSLVSMPQAEAPVTPDRVADSIAVEVSWDDHLTEESLFYAIPSGAMLTYRRSIESHLVLCEKTGSSLQEEVDTSVHDVAADICYADNLYNEEGETSTYYLHGDPDSKSTKHDQKKQKSFTRTFSSRPYEPGPEMPFGHCNIGSQQNVTLGKRPPNNYSVGLVPPKRSRTASRQRVVGPFNPGVTGALQAPMRTDASSGDTSSFQDDQSTLQCGSLLQKSVEVESVGDFEKQLPYDYTETTKPRKKKKAKHLGSSYEQGWQLDSVIPNDQRDSSKKRLEGHHFDSNCTSGFYGPPSMKRPKVAKQPMDGTLENMAPMAGFIPSPAASQMSNMSNTNKFIKIFNGREKGRKSKSFKISSAQSGPGSPWSLFEDQALVVLVHDMGPNWELVSDAINNTLQFKCIFRKPKECKERHKFLMDKGAGDGADSAEDSGSSQSYPSTLPGIPKGSARQLLQRLQGPMEEDTLKSHFEKIIIIGKKQHFTRNQNDHLDGKQPVPPHNSHVIALSQVCPNNLNGVILTPLDLCDASPASADVHHIGYQGSHGNNLGMPNQGSVATALPTSAANASLQGTSGVVIGNNSPSPAGPVNLTVRDGRYNPRTPLPVEEQRLQQMLSARGLPQASMSASGHLPGADRGVRMLNSGNGMGMMSGANRNMPIPRPGLQGMTSSPMLNSGNLIPSTVAGVQNPVNSQAGSVSGSGNSMMRSRDTLHIMRPGNDVEHQRQMISPEHQMQTTSGNAQGMPSFNGISSAYGNQTIPSPGPTFPGHQPHHHQMSPQPSHVLSSPHRPHLQGPNHTSASQQHAYAIHRLAKERQLHRQRFAQQQQLAASGALVPHLQAPSQIPVSSSMPNSNQIPVQPSPQAVSAAPLTPSTPMNPVSVPQQQKHNSGRTMQAGASLTNQAGKQRQRQPVQQQFQQPGRHHPQQRQHSQLLQNSRVPKGIGRGNMIAHQNLAIEHSHLNDISLPQVNQGSEKGESMHLMPGQGMFPGPGLGGVQTSRSAVASSSQSPQKPFSSPTPPLSKQPNSDSSSQALPVTSSLALSSSHQAAPFPSMASNLQHLQTKPLQKQISQSHPNVQRNVQPSHQTKSDMPTKSHSDQGHSDQQLTSDNPKASTGISAVISQACNDSTTAVPISPTAQQWNLPETVVSNSATQPISGPLTHSGRTEPVVAVNQGLGQRQLSGGLPQHGHGALTKVIQSQQLFHPQEQQLQQEHQSPRK